MSNHNVVNALWLVAFLPAGDKMVVKKYGKSVRLNTLRVYIDCLEVESYKVIFKAICRALAAHRGVGGKVYPVR